MPAPETISKEPSAHGLPFGEFVGMMAALIAVNSMGIDMMLPALGAMGRDLGVSVENHQQLIIVTYVAAFGVGQLFWGPLADRYGRRPVLLGAMVVYAAMSFMAAHAASFELLLVVRTLQGLSSASTRVLTTSIIRDCYSGRTMAKVMSLSFMIFLAVPILAPSLGLLVMMVAPWHWIFYVLGGFSLGVGLWAGIRLPETLDPAMRRPISFAAVLDAGRQIVTNRYSVGYTIAMSCLYGGLLGFIYSIQQVLLHVFHAPNLFALCFAFITGCMALSALTNSRFVERYGMRMISHAALLAMIAMCLLRLALVLSGHETLLLFTLLFGVTFFFYSLTGSNFGAMAMEPMAHIAGTASSVQGFTATAIATAMGLLIGQSFAGTTLPLTLGWLFGGLISLGVVLVTEHGRLFRARNPQPAIVDA